MAVACASRFAVLKLEDDEISEGADKKIGARKNSNPLTKQTSSKSESKSKPKNKKKKQSNEIAELQNLAFSNGASRSKNKSSSSNSQTSQKQWEEWKKKDSEFVSDVYEQDLQEALLLSKIDYEEKKEVYDAVSKESEQSKILKKKKKNSQKKEKAIMSLDEFQNLHPSQIESGQYKSELEDVELSPKPPVPVDESDFFHKIEEESEKIINREHRQDHFKALEPLESARALQFQEELRKKDEEISTLNNSLIKLKEEMKNVKSRNRKLYGILETGEMREKAEILVQIEQLLSVKDELTEQLNEYHTALEQERSKVHGLQTELKKCQNAKKNKTESK